MEICGVMIDAIKDVLRNRVDGRLLRRICSKPVAKILSKRLFEYAFYELLNNGVVKLPPGMGSLRVLNTKRRVAKVYDRKRKVMVERPASTRKIIYRPGDTIREFL